MSNQSLNFNFNIDTYLNPLIPRNRLYLLPRPISHFLGYRSTPQKPLGNIQIAFWSFLGPFVGILIIEAVFQTPYFKSQGAPIIIASLGAAAILEFSAITSPFSQPRNALLSQLIGSLTGVSITKLFLLSPSFSSLRFLAGALSVALTSSLMVLTKTVHPPAGATALLVATTAEITDLGWYYIPLVMLASFLMLATACVVNNIQRQFPIYWWTDEELCVKRMEEGVETEKEDQEQERRRVGSEATFVSKSKEFGGDEVKSRIVITAQGINIPDGLELASIELSVLEDLRRMLAEGLRNTESRETNDTRVQEYS